MRTLLLAAAIAIVACGGGSGSGSGGTGSTGSATLSGELRGQTFTPQDAISVASTANVNGTSQGFGAVAISTGTGLCSAATASKDLKSQQFLLLVLEEVSGNNVVAPTAPGDFQVGGTAKIGTAISFTNDSKCSHIAQYDATSVGGNVHLTSISNGAYAGTFDLQMEGTDGVVDHITGTFTAGSCNAAAAMIFSTQGTVCG